MEEASQGFTLRPSIIQRLQRLAIKDIYTCAGNFRTGPVFIKGTTHQPPDPETVSEHVEEMCDYVNNKWAESSPMHLAAFLMWKLNWIHPFSGGNGAGPYRTLCYAPSSGTIFPERSRFRTRSFPIASRITRPWTPRTPHGQRERWMFQSWKNCWPRCWPTSFHLSSMPRWADFRPCIKLLFSACCKGRMGQQRENRALKSAHHGWRSRPCCGASRICC